MQRSEETQQLLKSMLNLPLFVAIRRPANLGNFGVLLEPHLKWAIASEERGELFASGPFTKDGALPGAQGGMSIVRARDLAHATEIIQGDPFISGGVYTVTIEKWTLMEGAFNVQVRLSTQRAHFE
ncbi:YciI family protein [Pseudomonas fluorescens]|uniref:YciI family protein n=1 Tax=Pseudomonas fluorescens TaxID=294 RepID=UPI003F9A1DBF